MFDINFYMHFADNEQLIVSMMRQNPEAVFQLLESYRSPNPVIYNIETTNRCNMRCKMCPRTTLMTRPLADLSEMAFEKIVSQITPHSETSWELWKSFCERRYNIAESDPPSENHFFLYVISKVIQLHGFGEPVLDKNISKYIKRLHDLGFDSYFSTNPINIDLYHAESFMNSGLSYLKYCFDSVNNAQSKEIRGKANDFTTSFEKVQQVIEIRDKMKYETEIVITMINLDNSSQQEEYEKLCSLFEGKNVYIYLKSENSQWYRQKFHGTQAIHGSEICKHAWMSMTIKSDGKVAMCMDDYNNEIILGNSNLDSLQTIWNGNAYSQFRREMIHGGCEKCEKRCDLTTLYGKVAGD